MDVEMQEASERAWEEYQAMQNRGTVSVKAAEKLMEPIIYRSTEEYDRRTSGIGDISSDKPGSGARYNVGKPAYDLLPWNVLSMGLLPLKYLGTFQAVPRKEPLNALWD